MCTLGNWCAPNVSVCLYIHFKSPVSISLMLIQGKIRGSLYSLHPQQQILMFLFPCVTVLSQLSNSSTVTWGESRASQYSQKCQVFPLVLTEQQGLRKKGEYVLLVNLTTRVPMEDEKLRSWLLNCWLLDTSCHWELAIPTLSSGAILKCHFNKKLLSQCHETCILSDLSYRNF